MERNTLKDRALKLLCDVVATNAEGKSVGRPYGEICEILRAEFPGHKWDMPVSVRWYATKIQSGEIPGYRLPQHRPTTRWSGLNSLPPVSPEVRREQ